MIAATVIGSQVVEADSVSQGVRWNEGLNRMIPATPLAREMASIVAQELEKYRLSLTPMDSSKGRGLITTVAVKDGAVLCPASSLYYDSLPILKSVLELPGNGALSDRVVRIPDVMKEGAPRPVFATLCGAAGFIQHYQDIRARPNVVL